MNLSQYSENLSNHAIKRKNERGISNRAIELLLENCKERKQKGGSSVIHFNKKGKKHKILTVCHGHNNFRFKNYN